MDKRLKIYLNRDSSYDAIKGNKLLHYNWSFVTYKIYNIQLITIGPSYVPVGRLIHKPHIQMILQVQRSFDGSNESILNFKQFESLRDKMTPKSDEDIKRKLDNMPIDKALEMCREQGIKITDYLSIDKIKPLIKDKTIDDVLIFASEFGILELAQMALKKGADVNAMDDDGMVSLMLTSIYGQTEIAEMLIKNGADVNTMDNDRTSVLALASGNGHIEIVELLIKNGVNLEAIDNHGKTALLIASELGQIEAVKILIKSGANLKARSKNRMTALMLADDYGEDETVEVLKKYGAK